MKIGDRVDVLQGSPLEGLEGTVRGFETVLGIGPKVVRVLIDRRGVWLIPKDLLQIAPGCPQTIPARNGPR